MTFKKRRQLEVIGRTFTSNVRVLLDDQLSGTQVSFISSETEVRLDKLCLKFFGIDAIWHQRHLSVDVDYRPIYSSDGIALKRLEIRLSKIY